MHPNPIKIVVGEVYEIIECVPGCILFAQDNSIIRCGEKFICIENNFTHYYFITSDGRKFCLGRGNAHKHLKEI